MRAFFLLFLCGLGSLHAAAPVVSNISAAQRPNSRLVDITYDVAADFPTVSVSLQVSSNGGSTFAVPATTLSGAIGAGVATGTAKKITWDAGADWSGQYSTQMRFKVIADDGNAAPTISDIAAQTITEGNNTGALAFTVGDAQTAAGSLIVSGSSSNTTLVPNANIVFGGSGANRTVTVTPASSQTGTATITVTVSDGSLTASDTYLLTVNSAGPADMALIPQGAFTMGNSVAADTDITDAPTRTVTLDAFYMGKYEVTKAEWDEVRTWGLSNGYTDLAAGSGKASNHPVHTISWNDMVRWCNARSQQEGLTPVYYTNDAQTTIYKTGSVDVTNARVKWAANGYRLPTEAEWEKAARGGLSGKRFPWGDTISHSQANYYAASEYSYDLSGSVNNFHPSYYATGDYHYTSPVGAFAANGYGLYDMAGNVGEWCWDWYGTYAAGSQTNPVGSTSGTKRVVRGGGSASYCRIAYRNWFNYPTFSGSGIGFRVVRSLAPGDTYTPPDIGGGGNPGLNTAPTISDIADQTINEDGTTGEIDFTIGDAQTAASSLTLSGSSSNTTLVPNANIVLGGSGANRTVTVTPASSQTGTATITVTVSDGTLTASDSFVLIVNSGNWFLLGSMNDAANWGRLVSSYGGNIYSYAEKSGGFLKYEPTAKIFSNLPTPPNSTWGSVSLWLNGKYYLIGGYQSSKTVSYDPNTNTWSTLADAPRQGFFQAVALNGKIYLIGGTSGGLVSYSSQCSVYDPSSGWSALPSLPNPRHGAAVVAEGGDIYVIGGAASSFDLPANTVYKFSSHAFSWSELPSMPTNRSYAEAFFDNGYIYVIGGYPQSGQSAQVGFKPSPFERYQISVSSWTSLPPLEFSGEYYYHGIIQKNGSFYSPNHAQKFNLAQDQWVSFLSRPEESSGVPVVLNGKIYLVSRSSTSFSVYEYTP